MVPFITGLFLTATPPPPKKNQEKKGTPFITTSSLPSSTTTTTLGGGAVKACDEFHMLIATYDPKKAMRSEGIAFLLTVKKAFLGKF